MIKEIKLFMHDRLGIWSNVVSRDEPTSLHHQRIMANFFCILNESWIVNELDIQC